MKFAFFILYLLHFLPLPVLHLLARFLGWIAYYLAKERRHVGEVNLKLCFPEYSEKQRALILRANFYHMAAFLLEYGVCWYSSAKRIKTLLSYVDKHFLDEALAQNQHVILLYPHFNAFEMGLYTLNQDVPLVSMYSHQKNKTVDEALYRYRHRYNNTYMVSRQEGFKNLLKTIKKNPQAPFVYLPDQDFGPKDSIFVDFFGVKTATITGLPRIARMTNAKVIPMIAVRDNKGTFRLEFHPAWENFPTGNEQADTQRMNDFIEQQVRKYPEQYFWLHKRFKTRPDGEKSLY